MVVMLPRHAGAAGLRKLENKMVKGAVDGWVAKLARVEVDVKLPRFEISTPSIELVDTLAELGMRRVFQAGRAELTGMVKDGDLWVSNVLHKAFVKVDEKGTEAAAATGVGVRVGAVRRPAIPFHADHPFVFAIRHAGTGAMLFVGRVERPGA